MHSPWTDWIDAGVSVLGVARGAGNVPEAPVVAGEGLLNGVLAGDGVGVTEYIANVVAGPFADWVGFQYCSAIYRGVGLFAYAHLSVPLS